MNRARAVLGATLALSISTAGLARAETAADSAFLSRYAATSRFTLGRPTAVQLTPAGDAALFLRSGPRSLSRDLYLYDLASRTERVLASADSLLGGVAERLTAEERAARERKRLSARGIASFALSHDGRRVLVPLSGRLFVVERASGRRRELVSDAGAADAPRFSPDGRSVSCVRDGDLYVLDIESGEERRLTRREHPEVAYGLAEFAAQEEMNRFEGHWWSPDSRWIAVQRTDTRGMERFHIADPAHPETPPDAWPYPRAGGKNADVRLGVMPAAGGPTVWVAWDRARFPYLAKVTWSDQAPLTLLVQNRQQTEQRVLAADPATGRTTTLLVERDAAWINLWKHAPLWLADGRGFLWVTERRGAPQLELRDRRGTLVRTVTPPGFGLRDLVHVNREGNVAWVIAGASPTEAHLHQVPLDPLLGAPRPVTTEPGVYSAVFPAGGDGPYALEVSTLAGARRLELRGVDGAALATLRSVAEEPDFLPELELTSVGRAPELRAALIRPRHFDARRRYPVIAHVYGGPLSQTVMADRRRYLLDQWVADHGYIVVCLDARGTPARGRAWERAIRGDFMTLPLEDHVAGLRALGAKYRELDLARVGVWGWSFGGYFAAMAVLRRPEVFHAAVAGGPVVDWRDYDTHYTERYLGLPQARTAAYDRSSVLTYASRLSRPLLIVHGTGDDNVYLLHSLKLCEALNRAGKDYEFLPLVSQTHMVADPLATVRLYSRMMRHFDRALTPAP